MNKLKIITLKARKLNNGDVQLYKGNKKYSLFPNDYSNKPTKRNRFITINCCKFELKWVN